MKVAAVRASGCALKAVDSAPTRAKNSGGDTVIVKSNMVGERLMNNACSMKADIGKHNNETNRYQRCISTQTPMNENIL